MSYKLRSKNGAKFGYGFSTRYLDTVRSDSSFELKINCLRSASSENEVACQNDIWPQNILL